MSLWRAVDDQRRRLADLLGELGPDEWERPSLCTEWTVHQVAGHLALQRHPREMLRVAAGARSGVDAAIRDSAIRLAARYSPAELTSQIGGLVHTRRRVPYPDALSALTDITVHSLDIAVALNRPMPVPPDIAALIATRVWKTSARMWPTAHQAARTLTATDVTWQAGEGPPLTAPIVDLLLILTGRHLEFPE